MIINTLSLLWKGHDTSLPICFLTSKELLKPHDAAEKLLQRDPKGLNEADENPDRGVSLAPLQIGDIALGNPAFEGKGKLAHVPLLA
jgi:hypothetical protein